MALYINGQLKNIKHFLDGDKFEIWLPSVTKLLNGFRKHN